MFEYRRPCLRDVRQNYAGPGAWFITINTFSSEHLFGAVVDGTMCLNEFGRIAHRFWREIPEHFGHARLDAFVVMPNHLHGMLELASRDPRLKRSEDCKPKFGKPVPGTLGTIIGSFKGAVTREVSRLSGHAISLWQSDFFDRRIRSLEAMEAFRDYIRDNPMRWQLRAAKHSRRTREIQLPPQLPAHLRPVLRARNDSEDPHE